MKLRLINIARNTNRIIVYCILSITCSLPLFAQQTLSLEQAVEIAMKNKHSILIARNQSLIARHNFTPGNAGFLPHVSLQGSYGRSSNDTRQEYASGLEVDRKGATSINANTGAELNWVLFDGFRMFASWERLRELYAMGETQVKLEIENTVAGIMNAYYTIVRQKQLLSSIDSAITIYEERLRIAELRGRIGSSSRLDYLQAQIDLNEQRSNRLRQRNALETAKATFNLLLAREAEIDFDVADSMPITYHPAYADLKTSVVNQNNALQLQLRNITVAQQSLKEIRSQRYPMLSFNLSYNLSNTENQAGFLLFNRNRGLFTGVTASWTLFNGFHISRQIKNSELFLKNEQLFFEQQKQEVSFMLIRAFREFTIALEMLAIEEESAALARENVTIALERFRLGSSTTIELKQAQQSLDDAMLGLVSARYEAKIAETELMRLNGMLVR